MATDREERIRQLAHEIWEREGHPHGRDAEHWRMATEAYEAEVASTRLDDAGQPIAGEPEALRDQTMRTPAAAPKGRRGRKLQEEATIAPMVETAPATKRKRRTKAEMAAAAAGVAGAAAAAIVATVAVTRRRRGAKTGATGEATPTPAADAALRRPRKRRSELALSETEPAPAAAVSDAAIGAIPDPSVDGPIDVASGPVPDPEAEPPPGEALESLPGSRLVTEARR